MQPNGMIFWDWNGTLMDDVDFTHSCLNWMLETHGYPPAVRSGCLPGAVRLSHRGLLPLRRVRLCAASLPGACRPLYGALQRRCARLRCNGTRR